MCGASHNTEDNCISFFREAKCVSWSGYTRYRHPPAILLLTGEPVTISRGTRNLLIKPGPTRATNSATLAVGRSIVLMQCQMIAGRQGYKAGLMGKFPCAPKRCKEGMLPV